MPTILFDLDGTLIDSTDAVVEGFHVAFDKGRENIPSKEAITSLIGLPLDRMFSHLGIEEEKIDMFVSFYKEHYREISTQKTSLLPQAKDSVEKAFKEYKLGVVTTKTGLYSKILLEHLEILDYFDVLIGREDVINPKPHPEPILKAIKAMNADPQKCWMIGDTCYDIESATRANIKSVAVLSGYGKKEQLQKCSKILKPTAFEAVDYILSF